jgi:hypothetical protein
VNGEANAPCLAWGLRCYEDLPLRASVGVSEEEPGGEDETPPEKLEKGARE